MLWDWAPVVELLRGDHRVIVLDRPGCAPGQAVPETLPDLDAEAARLLVRHRDVLRPPPIHAALGKMAGDCRMIPRGGAGAVEEIEPVLAALAGGGTDGIVRDDIEIAADHNGESTRETDRRRHAREAPHDSRNVWWLPPR